MVHLKLRVHTTSVAQVPTLFHFVLHVLNPEQKQEPHNANAGVPVCLLDCQARIGRIQSVLSNRQTHVGGARHHISSSPAG